MKNNKKFILISVLGAIFFALVICSKALNNKTLNKNTLSPSNPLSQNQPRMDPNHLSEPPKSPIHDKSPGILKTSLKSPAKSLQQAQSKTNEKILKIHIDFDNLKNRSTSKSQSSFAKTYIRIARGLKFTKAQQISYDLVLDHGVENVTSLVLHLEKGQVDLQDFYLNGLQEQSVQKKMFEGDWLKINASHQDELDSIYFSGQGQSKEALVSVYLQKLSGENK